MCWLLLQLHNKLRFSNFLLVLPVKIDYIVGDLNVSALEILQGIQPTFDNFASSELSLKLSIKMIA